MTAIGQKIILDWQTGNDNPSSS